MADKSARQIKREQAAKQGRANDAHPDTIPHTGKTKTVRSNS